MFILGEVMSIFARKTCVPSSNSPAFIRSKISKFSSTERVLKGDSIPGSKGVLRCSLITSEDWSSMYAFPSLIN